MNDYKTYAIHGRKVSAIGVWEKIIELEAKDRLHALQRAERLYEEGWEHLSVHRRDCNSPHCNAC